MLILRDRNGRVWLEQRPQQGIWGGLWCFPQTDDVAQMEDALKARAFDARADSQPLNPFRHTFSHYHLDIVPLEVAVDPAGTHDSDGRWVDPQSPGKLGLAAPVKKLLAGLDAPRQSRML